MNERADQQSVSSSQANGAAAPQSGAGTLGQSQGAVESQDAKPKPRCGWIFLGGVILLGLSAAAMFIQLGGHDLWLDEVHSYIASTELLPNLLRWETPSQQYHSALPYIEQKIARQVIDDQVLALRTPAAVYSVLSVLLLYLAVGSLYRWGPAFVASLLLLANPFFLEHAREARMYPGWLFWTIAIIAAAGCAVRFAAHSQRRSAVDWRWWVLGLCLVFAYASALHSLFTIAAVLGALVVIGLIMMAARGRAGLIVWGGIVIACIVFVSGWSLAGVGKVMLYKGVGMGQVDEKPADESSEAQPTAAEAGDLAARVAEELPDMLAGFAGVPWWAASGLVGLSVVGLFVMMFRGRPALALVLLAVIAGVVLLEYTFLKGRDDLRTRYLYAALASYSVGLGVLIMWPWSARSAGLRWTWRVACLAVLAGVIVIGWAPGWNAVYARPHTDVSGALAPIREHGQKGDALVFVPGYLSEYLAYPPYAIEQIPLVTPLETLIARAKLEAADRAAMPGIDLPSEMPEHIWLVIYPESKDATWEAVEPLMQAYGLAGDDIRALYEQKAAEAHLLSFRITQGALDHGTVTRSRWQKPARGDGAQAQTDAGDASTPDVGTSDAGTADADTADTGTTDAGTPDASTSHAGDAPTAEDELPAADSAAADEGTTEPTPAEADQSATPVDEPSEDEAGTVGDGA